MSFSILRTNTGLTTNAKIMIDKNYGMYVAAIPSNSILSDDKYQKMEFNKDNYLDEIIPYFFKGLSTEISYDIHNDDDSEFMKKNYDSQYSDFYTSGARNISYNKYYKEEFEYFAPLYFDGSLPENFIIFRVDGPGVINLTNANFRKEILQNLKCVSLFDLTKNSVFGEFLSRNLLENKQFPLAPLEIDFKKLEFSKWNGIDYETGGYSSKSLFLDSHLESEKTLFDFEKFIFDGFKNNKIIFPNILNLSFLFDDTPATPKSLRKWSSNRYFGFYIDKKDLVKKITPYNPPTLKSNIVVEEGNYLTTTDYSDPFVDGYKSDKVFYIEYNGDFFKIEPYEFEIEVKLSKEKETVKSDKNKKETIFKEKTAKKKIVKYKIISDIDLSGKQSYLNSGSVYIVDNYLVGNDTTFNIENYDEADVWIIDINGKYHNIIKDDSGFKINSDYAFEFESTKYKYWINETDESYTTTVTFDVDNDTTPPVFKIYKLMFSDIKDFDTDIVDTDWARYEYEKKDEITYTEEPKLYMVDYNSELNPRPLVEYNYMNDVLSIPVASEYMTSGDLFRLTKDGDLYDIWKKNPVFSKWGWKRSLSSYDYAYRLNNSLFAEIDNKSPNISLTIPTRSNRNLDYFYTKYDSSNYEFTSLHTDIDFEIDKYLNFYEYITENGVISLSYSFYANVLIATFSNSTSIITTPITNFGDFDVTEGDFILYVNTISPTWSGVYQFSDEKYNFHNLDLKEFDFVSVMVGDYAGNNYYLTGSASSQYIQVGVDPQYYSLITGELNTYNSDYFSYYFNKSQKMSNRNMISKKYSLFSNASEPYTNSTLFRGIKFDIYGIDKVMDDGTIVTRNTNEFDNYKFSIILSKNNFDYNYGPIVIGSTKLYEWADSNEISSLSKISNNSIWTPIHEWQLGVDYKVGDYIKYGEWIWECITDHNEKNPNKNPANLPQFNMLMDNIFSTYYDISYKWGDYYYKSNPSGTIDFWNPTVTYSDNDLVIGENGTVWKSNKNNNITFPSHARQSHAPTTRMFKYGDYYNLPDWQLAEVDGDYTSSDLIWSLVSIWPESSSPYVFHNDVIYATFSSEIEPDKDSSANPLYSFVPNDNFKYNNSYDYTEKIFNIITINNNLYMNINSDSEDNSLGLDSGINIYINKKYKNILVDININDNTFVDKDLTDFVSDIDRDSIYTTISSKLTCANFINSINNIGDKNGFVKYLNYFIFDIDEEGRNRVKKYNYENINEMPYIIKTTQPDTFGVRINSLKYRSVDLNKNLFTPKRFMKDSIINSPIELNYFNPNEAMSLYIEDNKSEMPTVKNDHGITNIKYRNIRRYSGFYEPIFKEVKLFSVSDEFSNIGNYKFDTDLYNFGMVNRIISKVNKDKSILKLDNVFGSKSVYPCIDEFGYTVQKSFIFKSPWDTTLFFSCVEQDSLTIIKSVLIDNKIKNNNPDA